MVVSLFLDCDFIELALFKRIEWFHCRSCLKCCYICLEVFILSTKLVKILLLPSQKLVAEMENCEIGDKS